jgi:hypothetical protein
MIVVALLIHIQFDGRKLTQISGRYCRIAQISLLGPITAWKSGANFRLGPRPMLRDFCDAATIEEIHR